MVKELGVNSPKFSLLSQGLEHVLAGRWEEADRALASLRARLDVDAHAEDMQYLIFAAALSMRMGGEAATEFNLYRRRFEQSQIGLFSLLSSKLPFVSMASAIANEMLTGFIRGQEAITVLDVGIGRGLQEVALLDRLAEADALPQRIHFFAVEPDQDSLNTAREALSAAAQRLGVVLSFHGVACVAEELSEEHWRLLESLPGRRLATAAFALHHIAERPAPEADAREGFFQRLARWAPAGVVLCEPSSNHHRVSLGERFHHAWRHYFFVFQLLEELDISRQEKNAIKLFFSREVEDIVGTEDETRRSERHEHVSAWLSRLVRTGFQPAQGLERAWPAAHPAIAVRPHAGYVGLEYREETVVAILCASVAPPAA
ncbi:GRAS-like transcription factor [Stigmatella aurantiaca DW4/3-1]|uniref:GAI protein, putative n=1 Tax=Stigmatella aurantiaca (strain DW4/3-1) TaxID=378806 RepID=Q097U0_STIAD|nr:GRAS-like transcription factor [Stigmatella aurantiaca DW4/3-1]EAU67995.1 GAI protein, putative [Stigmatella aurantiaca DW4/3-1]